MTQQRFWQANCSRLFVFSSLSLSLLTVLSFGYLMGGDRIANHISQRSIASVEGEAAGVEYVSIEGDALSSEETVTVESSEAYAIGRLNDRTDVKSKKAESSSKRKVHSVASTKFSPKNKSSEKSAKANKTTGKSEKSDALYNPVHARELLSDAKTITPRSTMLRRELIEASKPNKSKISREHQRFIFQKTKELLVLKHASRSPQSQNSKKSNLNAEARKITDALTKAAKKHQMDPLFLMAVINQESQFDSTAVGSVGEIGLMQIKPSTAIWLMERSGAKPVTEDRMRENLKDPAQNIRWGAEYLALLRESFDGRSHAYISAYNMGATRVRDHLKSGVQPKIYSDKVLTHYVAFSEDILRNLNGKTKVAKNQKSSTQKVASTFGQHRQLN